LENFFPTLSPKSGLAPPAQLPYLGPITGTIILSDDLIRAAERQNARRYTKNAQRMRRAFGAASGPEGHALVQRHVGRLTEWIKADRANPPKGAAATTTVD